MLTADVAVADEPTSPNTVIRCRLCGNVLGVVNQGDYICQVKRRQVVYRQPVSITCEDCGAVWTPEQG